MGRLQRGILAFATRAILNVRSIDPSQSISSDLEAPNKVLHISWFQSQSQGKRLYYRTDRPPP